MNTTSHAQPPKTIKIALAGNPNCGKTTVFNALTGARQKVANWAGVTVEKKSGLFSHAGQRYEVVDLPGTYALDSSDAGIDEQIARRFLLQEQPDLIINVVDASNLKRHLLLTQELLTLGLPCIVVLNMLDVAQKKGLNIDPTQLSDRLGVPVVTLVASRQQGLDTLREVITAPRHHTSHPAPHKLDIVARYNWAREVTQNVNTAASTKRDITASIDRVVLNRWLGIPIFLGVMYLMFSIAVNVGAVFIDFFDILLGAILVDGLGQVLSSLGSPEWLRTVMADGVGGGIQLVGTFIPVIGFLYLCLSVLEDSGYMARAAFVVDRVMTAIGLPGSCFVPLIVGFGCNVPAVMASRALSREQDRLLTIAMAPFMSCGARLTVYALFAAAFFHEQGSSVVFALYLLGILMAVLTGWLFRKTLFAEATTNSVQEMPAYHFPVARNILFSTWHRLMGFVRRAGKTIIIVVTLLTVLNSLSLDGSFGHQDSQGSVLSVLGKTLTPALAPMGVHEDNWPATVGIFTGVFAKEAVVGTLDALYQDVAGASVDDETAWSLPLAVAAAFASVRDNALGLTGALLDPLGLSAVQADLSEQGVSDTGLQAMQSLFVSAWAAFCYLVFILLYTPCVAVLGAMNRESGAGWTSLVAAWSTWVAYSTATVLYQLTQLSQTPVFSALWITAMGVLMWGAFLGLTRLGRARVFSDSRLIPLVSVG